MSRFDDDVMALLVRRSQSVPKKTLTAVLDAAIDVITQNAKDGNDTLFPRLGKFKAVDIPQRIQRDPNTQRNITVDAHRVVRFTASTALSAEVWSTFGHSNDESSA